MTVRVDQVVICKFEWKGSVSYAVKRMHGCCYRLVLTLVRRCFVQVKVVWLHGMTRHMDDVVDRSAVVHDDERESR